ncbi:ABC transporter substrate-binding protein [Niveibacterium umoris]|uniref:Polar amino acid transport system substrate-binding protein n=1 Tax=Niveibacterium umoris TaxID=1193620 RepID=A0A840BLB3_9RHOO|nr:transporter substrate-binding domain-containing protein [Niveibacterium umoris]MBB4013403.1 polar amino acid transport system substrate-binding protein [Niveibacterium umoris]
MRPLPACRRIVTQAFLIAATLGCVMAPASASGELLVMTEEVYPQSYLRNGEVVGTSTALVEQVLAEAGVAYRLDMRAWAAVMQTAEARTPMLLYPLARTAEREAGFIWIGQLDTLEHRIYKLARRGDLQPRSLDELHGHMIGVVKRDARETFLLQNGFRPDAELLSIASGAQGLRLMLAGRLDYLPISPDGLAAACREENLDCSQFEFVMPLGLKLRLYLAASLATPPATVDRIRIAWSRIFDRSATQRLVRP